MDERTIEDVCRLERHILERRTSAHADLQDVATHQEAREPLLCMRGEGPRREVEESRKEGTALALCSPEACILQELRTEETGHLGGSVG